MRLHLGHHFYGAGNLGDDFMVAGFLAALQVVGPPTRFTCCVPFPLPPLRRRFPAIEWLPYDDATRARCIAECNAWLGLGGSPFQSDQSRWFIDHLGGEAELCAQHGKPMFFLGVGVQTTTELAAPEVQQLCAAARGIWTRDTASAERLRSLEPTARVDAAADLAHHFFRHQPVPAAKKGRLTLVANFDYGTWPGQAACLQAIAELAPTERVWLAQESRELPGAERALFAALPDGEKSRWTLVSPDEPGEPLAAVLSRWPSGEWLVTSRYHAAIAGAWAGSKVVVIGINEKLRGVAHELAVPLISPDADLPAVRRALAAAAPVASPHALADRAFAACAAFARSAVAHGR